MPPYTRDSLVGLNPPPNRIDKWYKMKYRAISANGKATRQPTWENLQAAAKLNREVAREARALNQPEQADQWERMAGKFANKADDVAEKERGTLTKGQKVLKKVKARGPGQRHGSDGRFV